MIKTVTTLARVWVNGGGQRSWKERGGGRVLELVQKLDRMKADAGGRCQSFRPDEARSSWRAVAVVAVPTQIAKKAIPAKKAKNPEEDEEEDHLPRNFPKERTRLYSHLLPDFVQEDAVLQRKQLLAVLGEAAQLLAFDGVRAVGQRFLVVVFGKGSRKREGIRLVLEI